MQNGSARIAITIMSHWRCLRRIFIIDLVFQNVESTARSKKFQIPTSKLQRSTNHQIPKSDHVSDYWSFEIWSFFGCWCWELGASRKGEFGGSRYTTSAVS